ncbi:glucokinase [Chelatococcus reniformis]|uniref:Glucokinase n=1 Tax=Chelatococcus reniformis TaxID=1494448 RepID=A0A916USB4_9HYPH|nr:glucokinase [Chelatococcus reniformis]GGC84510.1 glucokinase [Chelatococcus reniformis]
MTTTAGSGTGTALLADIGGTNARFALLAEGVQAPVAHFAVADFARFDEAMAAFLDGRKVDRAAIAVAGPVRDGRVDLTNSDWVVDRRELEARFAIPAVTVVNDFEALARAVPTMEAADLEPLGGGGATVGHLEEPIAIVGPGTGLGVACLVPTAAGLAVLDSEGGHVTAPSWSARTDALIGYLRGIYGHVSAERLVSGQGLENLFRAIVAVDRRDEPLKSAVDITTSAVAGTSATSVEALELFCAMLGEVAGNLALAYGAKGGVYIAGGIGPRIVPQLKASQFRTRFTDKGRFQAYLEAIPTFLITHTDATFLGLKAIVDLHPAAASSAVLAGSATVQPESVRR